MNEVEWTKIELFYGIGGEIPHTAELTVHEGQHLYRAHTAEHTVTIRITENEYCRIQENPNLYYFSSAVKVSVRAQRASRHGLGLNWPENDPAPSTSLNTPRLRKRKSKAKGNHGLRLSAIHD